VLGGIELVIAVLLLAWPLSPVPVALAGVLFVAFAIATGMALRRAERFECACFGPGSRISVFTVLRALGLALAALAAAAVAGGVARLDIGMQDRLVALVTAGLVLSTTTIAATLLSNRPFDPSLREGG
jgi:hypothetical protein